MTKDDSSAGADLNDIKLYRDFQRRCEAIRGGALPSIEDLLAGAPWCDDDLDQDIRVSIADALLSGDRYDQLVLDALDLARRTCTLQSLKALEQACQQYSSFDWPIKRMRMNLWMAELGDMSARRAAASTVFTKSIKMDAIQYVRSTGFLVSMLGGSNVSSKQMVANGLERLQDFASFLPRYLAAESLVEKHGVEAVDGAMDVLDAVIEDRAEVVVVKEPKAPAAVVVPALDEKKANGQRRDLYKSWAGMAGEPLPLRLRGDLRQHSLNLMAAYPHLISVVETLLMDLATSERVRFRPTLLVGPAGAGKSSFARAVADEFGMHSELHNLAGQHDGSLMGTSAQWSTAREHVALQAVKASGIANPTIIWDEIEKIGTSRHNGNAADALLGVLEVDQAKRFRDLCLEVECDLSYVNHFATANSLEGVPRPLLDRLRIIQVPEPGWAHVGVLTRRILDRVAVERGYDPRWYPSLAQDELEVLQLAWNGGSMRRLRQAVEATLSAREAVAGRM